MRSQSAVEVSDLTKYYGKLLAVDHINFNVKMLANLIRICGFLMQTKAYLFWQKQ